MDNRWQGLIFALLAALLFGASTPLAKSLLPQVTPMLMAGLLYLGSGIGLGIYALLRSCSKGLGSHEAALVRKDVPWLAAAIAAGGVVGPILLMWGLSATPASSASLLLNFEGVLTALLAWFVFKENFDVRLARFAADEKKVDKPKPYPLKTCITDDEKLGSMGDPYVFIHEGREIKLCCSGRLDDFKKNPAKYIKKLEKAEKKAKK